MWLTISIFWWVISFFATTNKMQAWLGATNFQSSVNFANVFYYTYMGNEHATVRVRLGRSKIFCSFLFFVLSLLTLHNLIRARMVFLCHHLALFQVSLIDLKLKILNREVDSNRRHIKKNLLIWVHLLWYLFNDYVNYMCEKKAHTVVAVT